MTDIIMAEAPIAIGFNSYDNSKVSFYPLTPCCAASGKGSESETGVVCRKCYRTVDAGFGGFWYADESEMMVGKYNIAGRWADYTRLLTDVVGVAPAKAEQLTHEAQRQAAAL
jgi:hypothetical protein